jgi:hypothetical protein
LGYRKQQSLIAKKTSNENYGNQIIRDKNYQYVLSIMLLGSSTSHIKVSYSITQKFRLKIRTSKPSFEFILKKGKYHAKN